MKVTLESTERLVTLVPPEGGPGVPARMWEGETASGIRVHAFITRVAIRQEADDAAEFERELQTHRPLSPEVPAYSLRLIL